MSSLLWCGLTLLVFYSFRILFIRTRNALLHPVFWGTVAVVALIEITGHSYADYSRETLPIKWLLGPAVVALSLPVYRLRHLFFANRAPLAIIVVTGVCFSMGSIFLLFAPFHLDTHIVAAFSLKSITAPVAIAVAHETGIIPELAALGTMFAGIMGAVLGASFLRLCGVRDARAVGLALGCTSHGIGTAAALELGEKPGSFASVGMSCTAIVASFACPAVLGLILKFS